MTGAAVEADQEIRTRPSPACHLCGGEGEVLHRQLEDRLFGVKGRWNFRRCRADGLVWLDPQPLTEELPKLYHNYYTHGGTPPPAPPPRTTTGAKLLLARLMPWRRHAYLTELMHLEDMPAGRLLEIGCGNGAFLATASAAGWGVEGLDFDAEAVGSANSRLGVTARIGDVLNSDYANASFDAIVMNNVLEHLPAPEATLAKCRALLRPGGRLVVITPNADALGHRLYEGDWRGLEVTRHLIVFNPANLREIARRAGFSTASAFSSAGGEAGHGILDASAKLRGKARLSARLVLTAEKIAILAGLPIGEWAVLVAHR